MMQEPEVVRSSNPDIITVHVVLNHTMLPGC